MSNASSKRITDAGNQPPTVRRNIELKARCADLDSARRAEALGAKVLEVLHQRDTYFAVRAGRLKLREIEGQAAVLIWYDRPNAAASRMSRYLLVPVAAPELLKSALTAANGVCTVVQKQRTVYLYENVRIHLDAVAGLGRFLEFEAVLAEGQPAEDGHRQLGRLRAWFGIAAADLVESSYGELVEGASIREA